jgi:hypothetical protein
MRSFPFASAQAPPGQITSESGGRGRVVFRSPPEIRAQVGHHQRRDGLIAQFHRGPVSRRTRDDFQVLGPLTEAAVEPVKLGVQQLGAPQFFAQFPRCALGGQFGGPFHRRRFAAPTPPPRQPPTPAPPRPARPPVPHARRAASHVEFRVAAAATRRCRAGGALCLGAGSLAYCRRNITCRQTTAGATREPSSCQLRDGNALGESRPAVGNLGPSPRLHTRIGVAH